MAVLKEETGSASGGVTKARLASTLVVAQISLSLLLLICAGLFIRSVRSARAIDPGFNPHKVLMASYDLFAAGYTRQDGLQFDRELVSKLEQQPGVQSVALSDRVPLTFTGGSTSVTPQGYISQANESMETQVAIVTPQFFRTLQVPLLEGRDFTLEDNQAAQRVVIVNQAFANRYWPNREALGKQLNSDLTHEWFTVVGVARDNKVARLNENQHPSYSYRCTRCTKLP
jgi:MacB-like periplasmic core domain